jgi:hypothetical protein
MPKQSIRPISKKALEQLLGQERLSTFSVASFGSVLLAADVASGRRRVEIMFREKPDLNLPFSGWVLLPAQGSSSDSSKSGLSFHDALAILRLAPEVADYLDLPPGTCLVRTGDKTFATTNG